MTLVLFRWGKCWPEDHLMVSKSLPGPISQLHALGPCRYPVSSADNTRLSHAAGPGRARTAGWPAGPACHAVHLHGRVQDFTAAQHWPIHALTPCRQLFRSADNTRLSHAAGPGAGADGWLARRACLPCRSPPRPCAGLHRSSALTLAMHTAHASDRKAPQATLISVTQHEQAECWALSASPLSRSMNRPSVGPCQCMTGLNFPR